MFISVRELELRKLHFDQDFPAGEIDLDSNQLRQVSTLHAVGTAELLNNTLGEIRVKGHISAEMEVACDRCLEPVPYPIDSDFDLFYRPDPGNDVPHDLAIDAGEAEVGFYEGDGIELSEILREYILLSMPMQQICREGCLGICPSCGQNRNKGACNCAEEVRDDRWAALRDIKGSLSK